MRKVHVIPLFLAFVFLVSCKKDAQVNKPTAPKLEISTMDLFYRGELDYEHAIAQIVGEKMRMVVPIKNIDGNKGYRYKISEFIKDGDPARSGFIISFKEITPKTDLFAIPINSKGSTFSNSKERSSSKDQNGKIVAKLKSENAAENVKQQGEVLNLYAGCEQTAQVCIDWYYATYDSYTGEVISENYLYTSCYDACSFNTNPGGVGSDGSGENCTNVVNSMTGGPTSVHEMIQYDSEDFAANERTYLYSWVFHKQNQGMWHFKSLETGVHKKLANGTWQWKSLTHTSVQKVGWTVGGTLTCTVNASVPHVALYNAGMELNYTITASVLCKGSPISMDATHPAYSPIWNVNQSPPVE